MWPTIITLLRVALAFVTVSLFERGFTFALAAIGLIIVVIWMDSLDGWVARRTGQTSDMGALFDITGDRIVENVFWIYFAVAGAVHYSVPLIVITRGFLTDTVRTLGFEKGQTPFGEKTMMRSRWTRFIVSGRFMRGVYGGAKLIAFCALGAVLAVRSGLEEGRLHPGEPWMRPLELGTDVLVVTTVVLCVVRGLPVLWDGREMLLHRQVPRVRD